MKNKPVFIAGVGPRTGSTLVQRLINTLPDAMIWGEWSGEHFFAQMYAAVKKAQMAMADRDACLYNTNQLHDKWTASMMPPNIDDAFVAFLKIFQTKPIWGFKTVHDLSYIPILQQLVPNPYFIVVYRNPLDQVKSCMTAIWPEMPPSQIVKRLIPAYQQALKIQNALLVDYNNINVEQIFHYINEPVSPTAYNTLNTKIRGPVPPPSSSNPNVAPLAQYYQQLKRNAYAA